MTRHVPDKPVSADVPEIPHFHGPDESTLEIVVRFKLLSLEQLLSCVNSRVLDEVDLTENVAELDRRPQSDGVLEVTGLVWVCSS